ncbi:MAG: TrpR YerC/YecD [Clostridia bacterium]|nr:TrpR YerC/YecD [Clostridia bacterium]MBP5592679.1 TrpR YerC/YecD [Clostridia bacterium]
MGLPHSEETDRLFLGLLSLNSVEECYLFFEDVCTIKEVLDMSQRLATAEMLAKGDSYGDIQKKVNVSTATISRVSRCLNYGSGGYELVIKNLEEKSK